MLGIGFDMCSPHEHLQPGRIAPSNLEPVKCRQRYLDRPESSRSRRRGCTAPEPDHFPGHAQAVSSQRERMVLQLAQRHKDALNVCACFDGAVDLSDVCIHLRQSGFDVQHALGVFDQQADAWQRPQCLVGYPQHACGGFELSGEISTGGGSTVGRSTGDACISQQRRGIDQPLYDG